MRTHITTTTRLRSVVAIAAIAATASGCGALVERATEQVVEEAVERAVEADSGGNVEIEFDDNGIRVETDEGDITFSADENGVEIDGVDADGNEFSLDADEDGLVADSESGGSIDLDSDGTFTATDADGEVVTGQLDEEDGSIVVDGSDGETLFESSDGVPEKWPDDIPTPDSLSAMQGTFVSEAGRDAFVLLGMVDGDPIEAFDRYSQALEDAGFVQSSSATGPEFATGEFSRDEQMIVVSVTDMEMAIFVN